MSGITRYEMQEGLVGSSLPEAKNGEYVWFEDHAASIAAKDALIEELFAYALDATKTLTGLAGGGSELFSGKIGVMHKADLQRCAGKVQDRHEMIHGLMVKAKKENNKLRMSLEECQSVLATFISPDAIMETTVLNAFSMATAADVRAREVLSSLSTPQTDGGDNAL